jgi:NAD(P)-dependent dehydrogenase (short-subunit alcohol dehydrogenase family)
MQITNSVAVVTGGASRLGYASARRLADRGARVVVVDLPSPAAEERVRDFATFASAHVSSADELSAAFDLAAGHMASTEPIDGDGARSSYCVRGRL